MQRKSKSSQVSQPRWHPGICANFAFSATAGHDLRKRELNLVSAPRFEAETWLVKHLTEIIENAYSVTMQQLANESSVRALATDCSSQLIEVTPLLNRRIREEMRSRTMPGLTLPQFRAMAFIRHHPNSSLREVAEHLGLTDPTASKLVQKLVVRKVVKRRAGEDRRRVCLSVTDAGAAALKKANWETRQQFANRLESLSREELATLAAGLRILRRAFSQGGNDVNLS